MRKLMKIIALSLIVMMVCAFGGALAQSVHIAPWAGMAIAAALYVGTLLVRTPVHMWGMVCNGIQKEIWTDYIDENFYKDNEFAEQCDDHSEYVNNLTVHSPQAGDDGGVSVNRSVFPATVTTRTDTTVDWDIDEFTVDPWKISNAEEVELSYNKLSSMLYSRRAILDEKIADSFLYRIGATGAASLRNSGGTNNNILRTTGVLNNDLTVARAFSAAYLPSATGNRFNFSVYDIIQAKLLLDTQNVPKSDRHIIFSARALHQITTELGMTKYRDAATLYDPATGILKMIEGFTVHSRSTVVRYDNLVLPVAKTQTAAAAADDNDAALFWHKMAVRRAKGETKVYDDADRPEYYGKLFSILKRFGAIISRNDEVGVGAIVQSVYTAPVI